MKTTNDITQQSLSDYHILRSKDYGSPIIEKQTPRILQDGVFKKIEAFYSDALTGVIGEVIDNTADQYARSIATDIPVTYIHASLRDGVITVENDGQPILVELITVGEGKSAREVWKPSIAFTEEKSGANFDDKKNKNRTTGGLNGLGAKLTNIYSKYFRITVCDGHRLFEQLCENNMKVIHEPIITELNEVVPTMVRLEFLPDYDKLCRIEDDVYSEDWINQEGNHDLLERLLEHRFYQISTLINSCNYKYDDKVRINYPEERPQVFFNNKEIYINNLWSYVSMFGAKKPLMVKFSTENNDVKFPWTVCIVPAEQIGAEGFEAISLINGLNISDGGTHVNTVMERLSTIVSDVLKKKFSKGALNRLFCYFDCMQMPIHSYRFADGNKKKRITVNTGPLNRMKTEYFGDESKTYLITDEHRISVIKMWKTVGTELAKYAKDNLDKLDFVERLEKQRKKKIINILKYEKAFKAGTIDSIFCGLFVSEGDSANTLIDAILGSKKSPLTKDHYGYYMLGGVPMNACKSSTEGLHEGKKFIVSSQKLLDNEALQGLAGALGLDYNYHYDITPEGDKQFRTLNYGFLIMATDQDLDGIGHICSLVMVFILRFWPNLFKPERRFFRRLATPIIRAYGKAKFKNFYDDREYRAWADRQGPKLDGYKIKYYKGLAGHADEEAIDDIAGSIDNNIICTIIDDKAIENMIAYYGTETNQRKIILSTARDAEYSERYSNEKITTVSEHFEVESKASQLGNMRRKIKSAVDGFIISQRKVFATARKKFANSNEPKKVIMVGGYVIGDFCYEHGDTSLNSVITKMGQDFPGSNNIPPLIRAGQFGSIIRGRSKAPAARYISVSYNKFMDLLFPRQDDPLLEYIYDEGKRCEPEFYVPIMPYSMLETEHVPGTGHAIDIHGRDWDAVMNNVRAMIAGDEPQSMLGQTAYYDHTVNILNVAKEGEPERLIEEVVCDYVFDREKSTIHITQLPPRVWTHKYKCNLMGIEAKTGKPIMVGDKKEKDPKSENYPKPRGRKCGIKKVIDNTDPQDSQVDITIKIKVPAIDKVIAGLEGKTNGHDPLAVYLGLVMKLTPQINLLNPNGYITEYKDYVDIMREWFPLRKQLYMDRTERIIALENYKVEYYDNVLRFIAEDYGRSINIDSDKADEDRVRTLELTHYMKFNKANLFNPNEIPNKLLEEKIKGNTASYAYIDGITKFDVSKSGIERLEKKKAKALDTIEEAKQIRWQDVWLAELDVLDAKYKTARTEGWVKKKKQTRVN